MLKQVWSLVALLIVVGTARAEETPTIEEVNDNPQKYVGKTLVFDNMQLRGDGWVHPKVMRFVVKSPLGTEFRTEAKETQRIFFGSPDKRNEVTTFVDPLKTGRYYPSRLTCEILKRTEKEYMASVRRIDLIKFVFPNQQGGDVIEGLTVEEVAKQPAKYVGKIVSFDCVEFTGQRKPRVARIALAVKTPGGLQLKQDFDADQRILFATPDKSKWVKAYLKDDLNADTRVPLRLVCEMLKTGENQYIASIKRIDLIGYDYDRKKDKPEPTEKPKSKPTTPPTIEDVSRNARKYHGQTLIFDQVRLKGGLVKTDKTDNFSLLSVQTPGGTLISADFHIDGLTFIAKPTIGGKLKIELADGKDSLVRMICRIRSRGAAGRFYLAELVQADFYDEGSAKFRTSIDAIPGTEVGGITGKWFGSRSNDVQGPSGEDWLFVQESKDGKVRGQWWGLEISDGQRGNDGLIKWKSEGIAPGHRYEVRCEPSKDGKTLLIRYTFFYKQNGEEESYEGQARLTKQ